MLLVAAHLPHVSIPTEIFTEVLQDLDGILAMHGDHDIIIGMDANTKLDGLVDHFQIGPHVPRAGLTPKEMERATLLHSFFVRHNLVAQNT